MIFLGHERRTVVSSLHQYRRCRASGNIFWHSFSNHLDTGLVKVVPCPLRRLLTMTQSNHGTIPLSLLSTTAISSRSRMRLHDVMQW